MQPKCPNVTKESNEQPPEEIPSVDVDMISNLPDELLCHILSFLTSKEAVATGILSRRWEFVWTYINAIDISVCDFKPTDEFPENIQFAQCVHTVLPLLRTPKTISLHGDQSRCNEHDIVTWIQTAISKNVESLSLAFDYINFKWPSCLFYSQTLVDLQLADVDITTMKIPTAPFSPNLKELTLLEPIFKTDCLNRFISGCSILESFQLVCKYNFVETYHVSSGTLKTFALVCNSDDEILKLVLNTPALESLCISEMRASELLVESCMPLLDGVQIGSYHLKSCLSYLECLSNLKRLYLEAKDSIEVCGTINYDLKADFPNLTSLTIAAPLCGLFLLTNFMEKADNLEMVQFVKTTSENESGTIWEEPKHVPECLLSSLYVMDFKRYENDEEMDSVIKYVLQNAEILENMLIGTSDSVKNDYEMMFRMSQKILTFPRASKVCKITFY